MRRFLPELSVQSFQGKKKYNQRLPSQLPLCTAVQYEHLYIYTHNALQYSAKHIKSKWQEVRAGSSRTSSQQADLWALCVRVHVVCPRHFALLGTSWDPGSRGHNLNKGCWGNSGSTRRHTHMQRRRKKVYLGVGSISSAALAVCQANLNIPMGGLRPGAGHPVKRREETADTEEVRRHWKRRQAPPSNLIRTILVVFFCLQTTSTCDYFHYIVTYNIFCFSLMWHLHNR